MTNAVCIMCGTRSGDAALLAEKTADRIADKDAEIERLERWKVEAAAVIEKWEHVAEPIVGGIDEYRGWFEWDAVAVEVNAKDAEIERLREENKMYRTELERIDPAGWRR